MRSTRANSPIVTRWAGRAACLAVLLPVWLSVHSAAASDPPKPGQEPTAEAKPKSAQKSLDDALLEDLDNELLEGLGDLKDRPTPSEPDGPADCRCSRTGCKSRARRRLGRTRRR